MHYGARLAWVLACAGALAGGCAATNPPGRDGGEGGDGGEADADVTTPDSGPIVSDDAGPTPVPDAGPQPDGAVAGLECEACGADADCTPGFSCVALAAGGNVCLRTCVPDLPNCPARFDCVESLITPLPEPVCAPVGERCCVDADGDDHGVGVGCRGLDCNDGDATTNAGAAEACDGADNDCDGMIDEGDPGAGFVCSTGMTGACASGATACEDGALVCRPTGASEVEICDGMDNDCDVGIDEDDAGLALTRPCYDGPAGTDGMGACAAGVQTCAGGEYRTCVGQVLPGTEVCDGADNDCDGTPDDGAPGGGIACTASVPGICAPGETACVGGAITCVSTIAPGTQPEICDDLDNDCDGTINDGFAGLGTACFSGNGICRRAGVTICDASDRSAPPVCDAVPGTPSASEACDYVDDDCDGNVDEGYRNAGGAYHTVAHCGACGFDCGASWPGGAAGYHVVPSCTVAGTSASCGFTCTSGYVDADSVRENGCELLPETDTIYVSTPSNGGSDTTSCGAWDSPCETIGHGINRAVSSSRARVRVSTGLYRENITLASGVSVLGGHSHVNWVRNPSVFGTTIRGLDAGSGNDRVVVTAVGITAPTELSGFTITGINAGTGGNSIGVYVRDSDNDLLIRDNDIAAGAAGNGGTGSAGTPGSAGSNGSNGAGPARRSCGAAATVGAAGGAETCGTTATSGGRGGDATNPALNRSGYGVNGSTARGGVGGEGGWHLEGYVSGGSTNCQVYGNPIEGGVGAAGTAGSDGAGGAGASNALGVISGTDWRGAAGVLGVNGAFGGGGGGGGSSAGVWANGGSYCLYPTTGGGGGAGGCGGTRGGAGTAGGASFAIFVLHTSTPTAGSMPRITGNRLRRGSGGRGGDGGTGGGGGDGGSGGSGGSPGSFTDTYAFCLTASGPGGAGGRGGHGGGGGGGAGGVSYDIWVSRPGSATPSYTGNTFDIPATVPTGGDGGTGGNSSNTSIGLGGAGVAGSSGTIRIGS